MKVVVGKAGTGKSLILTDKAVRMAKTNEVLIITDNPRAIFNRLGLVTETGAGFDSIVVTKATTVAEAVKYLVKHKNYKHVFIDIDRLADDPQALIKLEGFEIGTGVGKGTRLEIVVTCNINLHGTAGKVTISEYNDGALTTLEEYDQEQIRSIIR